MAEISCREEWSFEHQHYFSFCGLQLPEGGRGGAYLSTSSTAAEAEQGREMPQRKRLQMHPTGSIPRVFMEELSLVYNLPEGLIFSSLFEGGCAGFLEVVNARRREEKGMG